MRRGFTLIELLVVIAIIAILAAILFPVFARAREKARQTSCLANIKQISLSMLMYVQDYDEMTPIYRYNLGANPRLYWNAVIEPYLKNAQILKCPSRMQNTEPCHYGYNYDIDIWSIAMIDAPSETCWLNDSRNNLSHHPPMGDTTNMTQFLEGTNQSGVARAPHNDGLNLAFVDGHAKWFSAADAYGNAATYWPQ